MEFDFGPFEFLLGLILLVGIEIHQWKNRHSWGYLVVLALFWIYLLMMVRQTLFPIAINPEMSAQLKAAGIFFYSRVNLIPFYFGPYTSLQSITWNMGLNWLLTVPFGFFINFLQKTNGKRIFLYSIGIGLTIEILQFLIGFLLGYAYRVTDINDIIANALGLWSGYLLFVIFSRTFLWLTRRTRYVNSRLRRFIWRAAYPQRVQPL